jgi:hypothetical protein
VALQALVLRKDATLSAERYCMQSAHQLFSAHGPTDMEYWQGVGQPLLLQRKLFVKQVIFQLLEVYCSLCLLFCLDPMICRETQSLTNLPESCERLQRCRNYILSGRIYILYIPKPDESTSASG